jgi:hypothetical protein
MGYVNFVTDVYKTVDIDKTGVAEVSARNGSPEPVSETIDISSLMQDFYGVEDDFQLTFVGKTKELELPNDRTVILSPGLKVTLTNVDSNESVTVSAAGSFHEKVLPDGTIVTVATGTNVLFDPVEGLVVATGRFTFSVDEDGEPVQTLEGNGRIEDFIDLL